MLHSLNLLLPALIPSWRFFKSVNASPRVQWVQLTSAADTAPIWHDYRPRPQNVTLSRMVLRLFWNPWWNEALHMVSLAERLLTDASPYAFDGIIAKITTEDHSHAPYLQFRILLVSNAAPEIAYLSAIIDRADVGS